jgi:uncharacterized DUF497 family protein
VKFEWDRRKAAANWRKHGLTFEMAIHAFSDPFGIEELDDVLDYEETRWKLIGLAKKDLLVVIYTERSPDGEVVRLISARLAHAHEKRRYSQLRSGFE